MLTDKCPLKGLWVWRWAMEKTVGFTSWRSKLRPQFGGYKAADKSNVSILLLPQSSSAITQLLMKNRCEMLPCRPQKHHSPCPLIHTDMSDHHGWIASTACLSLPVCFWFIASLSLRSNHLRFCCLSKKLRAFLAGESTKRWKRVKSHHYLPHSATEKPQHCFRFL